MRALVAFCLTLTCGLSWSQSSGSVSNTAADIDEIVVTGEQPGPGLWKLTRNGHTLWILGTVTPKPRDIIWRSTEVANVLDNTQEVIDQQMQGTPWAANVDLDVKSFNPLAGLRAGLRAKKLVESLPSPPALRDALPADVYARYTKLKALYLPNDKTIETQSPRVAADRLYYAAVAAKGLTTRALIHEEVHKLARKRRIKVNDITKTYQFDLETMIQVKIESDRTSSSSELACLVETLSDLETNLPAITERANAWARGDVEKLRKLPFLRRNTCGQASWSAPRWANLDTELDNFWVETIETSVSKNESTLVMVDMAELLEPDGLLGVLGKRGFDIEEP